LAAGGFDGAAVNRLAAAPRAATVEAGLVGVEVVHLRLHFGLIGTRRQSRQCVFEDPYDFHGRFVFQLSHQRLKPRSEFRLVLAVKGLPHGGQVLNRMIIIEALASRGEAVIGEALQDRRDLRRAALDLEEVAAAGVALDGVDGQLAPVEPAFSPHRAGLEWRFERLLN
jgi:hypothetical protein